MREIRVSTGTFSRIWSLRQRGEESEEEILQRVLRSIEPAERGEPREVRQQFAGLEDQRFGVCFREGFEIDRTYLGQRYTAVVRGGQWVIDGVTGRFSKLNELSRAIGTRTENAWVNWFFVDKNGERRPVSELRDPHAVVSRKSARRSPSPIGAPASENVRWCDDIRAALTLLGGRASLDAIYRQVKKIRRQSGRSITRQFEATVRRTLEDFSSDSENFRGTDWFEMAEGKGSGVWALRTTRVGSAAH